MKNSKEILTIQDLEIGYPSISGKNILLPPLTASAIKGEMIAIIGRNGIGKSTLLRTLAGIQEQVGGTVRLFDTEIKEYTPKDLAAIAGYISTEPVRAGSMRVYDLVALGRYPYTGWLGNISPENHDVIEDALEKASIKYCSGKFITEVSDGERQRANIARLLAQDTTLMLMDEPTAFLDIRSRFEIFHLMYRLCHENGKTILYTTHDLNMAIRYSDKIWLLHEKGITEGSPEDLMLNGDFTKLYDSPEVTFNPDDATWSYKEENKAEIYITGPANLLNLTGKALKRAGYSLSSEATSVYIEITPDPEWILHSGENISRHSSIYNLINELTSSSTLSP